MITHEIPQTHFCLGRVCLFVVSIMCQRLGRSLGPTPQWAKDQLLDQIDNWSSTAAALEGPLRDEHPKAPCMNMIMGRRDEHPKALSLWPILGLKILGIMPWSILSLRIQLQAPHCYHHRLLWATRVSRSQKGPAWRYCH